MIKKLAKIIAVNGKDTLSDYKGQWDTSYIPDIDMYLFFSVATYDPDTGMYSGRLKLHDLIAKDYNLPELDPSQCNYLNVDMHASKGTECTSLRVNKRMYQLTSKQREYIAYMFNACH